MAESGLILRLRQDHHGHNGGGIQNHKYKFKRPQHALGDVPIFFLSPNAES